MLKKSLVIKIFVCLVVIFVGYISLSISVSHKRNSEALFQKELKDFSDGRYTIYFTKAGRGPKGDGSIFEVFSIKSDGSDLKFVKNEDSQVWDKKAYESAPAIFESMGNYVGHFESPDKTKRLFFKNFLFSNPELYVQNGKLIKFLRKDSFAEVSWLPDSERIIVLKAGKMWIINTKTNMMGYLTEGNGSFVFEESK